MKEKRRDNKGRILHTGESQRTDGKYLYKYVDAQPHTDPAEIQANLIAPSNCLPKTQVCAKSKDDVYELTPARCWKVKRDVQALNRSPSERRP